MHLLSGVVEAGSFAGSSGQQILRDAQDDKSLELVARVEMLEEMVRSLEERLKVLEDCGVFTGE